MDLFETILDLLQTKKDTDFKLLRLGSEINHVTGNDSFQLVFKQGQLSTSWLY